MAVVEVGSAHLPPECRGNEENQSRYPPLLIMATCYAVTCLIIWKSYEITKKINGRSTIVESLMQLRFCIRNYISSFQIKKW